MTQAVIHRVVLPLDDVPHGIDLTGKILGAAVRRSQGVDVWYQARPDGTAAMRRSFQVVGTNLPIPDYLGDNVSDVHQGTAVHPESSLVWHVLENPCPHTDVTDTTQPSDPPGQGTGICDLCTVALRGDGQGGWIPE